MYAVRREGPRAALIAAELRAVPEQRVPRALAQALTFTAQKAQQAILQEMPKAFDKGATPYTLNSTFVAPASPADLAARVGVKDRTSNNGTLPEDYLFPQVFGGPRKEKRFERAMRFAGLLQGGERAVLGQGAPLDAFGNLKRGEIQRILTATRSAFDPYQRKTDSGRSKRNAKNAPYFGARIGKTWGVWKRIGRQGEIEPILIFITKAPSYTPRLDFAGIAEVAARREFEPIFLRLLRKASA